jgi:hypothetical protein
LFVTEHSKLVLRGICLTVSFGGEACQITNCLFQIGSIGGIPISEVRNDKRTTSDQERKPFIYSQTFKKTVGAACVALSVVASAVGLAWFIGALSGRIFGLSRRDRLLCAIYGGALLVLSGWLLSQWGAPLLLGI